MENQSHLCSFSPSRKRPISGFSAQAQLQRSGGGSTTPEEHPGPPLRPAALCPRQLLLRAPRDVHPRPPTARAQAQARTQTRRETTRAHVPKPTRERGGGEDPDRRRRGEERREPTTRDLTRTGEETSPPSQPGSPTHLSPLSLSPSFLPVPRRLPRRRTPTPPRQRSSSPCGRRGGLARAGGLRVAVGRRGGGGAAEELDLGHLNPGAVEMYVPPLPTGGAGEQPRVYQVWRGSNVRNLYLPSSPLPAPRLQ